ncbi:MAG TPA: hypothetical protein VN929_02990 [Burkholderiales bacterium]|nr:hypothetical protein [Burkholderiales bacterium]
MAKLMMTLADALLWLGGAGVGCWAELWEPGSYSNVSLPRGR